MIPQVGLCYECRDRIPAYTPNPCGSVAFGYPSFSDTPHIPVCCFSDYFIRYQSYLLGVSHW